MTAPLTPNLTPSESGNSAKSLLRFITAGSVDDGKSSLIGRLLYDTQSIHSDQITAIQQTSAKRGLSELDLSLLTDGLQAEREQGITIDIAYRYFNTEQRKFIIGDAPGHEQYTRNMVTAASTADLAILLIDARKGVVTQTRRHTYLAHLLGVNEIVLAVNKMDLVDWRQDIYQTIRYDYLAFAASLGIEQVCTLPICALEGDNIVHASRSMNWYDGPTLIDYLNRVSAHRDRSENPLRFPVQRVARVKLGNGVAIENNDLNTEFRGYQGTLASGTLVVDDEVLALPSGLAAKIKSVKLANQSLPHAAPDLSVVVELDREIDISRGDMLVAKNDLPETVREIHADICWLSEEPLNTRRKYLIKHTTRTVRCLFSDLQYRVDVNTLQKHLKPSDIVMNDIVRVELKLQQPLFVDHYAENRVTGSFIIIDEATHATIAAGVIV
ncbi:sulfate adenylyltransferase subunit 1 [Methylotuvimicrobium sp. KM1]|uniref:sulfate adenylyltransferase subunit 1 n=1 Tax=Methylotuvimicrobium sp. KM1 TaxID=3377707 RepID=UPI003850D8D6